MLLTSRPYCVAAQASHDALTAQRLVQDVLLSSMARTAEPQEASA